MLSQTALDGGMAIARPLQFHDTLPVSRRSLRVPRDGLILLGFVALILVINPRGFIGGGTDDRSEEHTSELQSLMRISYAVFCLKKKTESLIHSYKYTITY